eukprot:jgi/Mesen1/1381/ME000013S00871
MASQRFVFSFILVLSLVASSQATSDLLTLLLGRTGSATCPLSDSGFLGSNGISGAIVDTANGLLNGVLAKSPSELYLHVNIKDFGTCKQACSQFPLNIDGTVKLKALNLPVDVTVQANLCNFFSFNPDTLECVLFDCGVCTDGKSFIPAGNLVTDLVGGLLGGSNNALKNVRSGSLGRLSCKSSGVTGDPHFSGADGSHFDFSGYPGETYCLVSDAHVHINAFYGGRYGTWGENTNKSMTWIRKVAILWGHHTVVLEARQGARWQYDSGYMANMEVDGERVHLGVEGDVAHFVDGQVALKWESARTRSGDDDVDVYSVTIGDVMVGKFTVRPEVAHLRTATDGVVHFSMHLPKLQVSGSAHGVLGQTYRPDHADRIGRQQLVHSDLLNADVVPGDNAEGFLDADVAAYRSSSLLSADCAVTRFVRGTSLDSESAKAIELSKGTSVSSGLAYRKMLTLKRDAK